jgi:hypothetical protein
MYNLTTQEVDARMVGRLLRIFIFSIVVLGFVTGCNLRTSQDGTPTHSPATAAAQTLEAVFTKVTFQTQQPNQDTETAGLLPEDANTSSPAPHDVCINRAHFVDDITIRDNTQVDPEANFVKVWRLRNDGTCVWNRSYTLTFFGGERMGAPNTILLPKIVQPGQTIDLSIDMTAPEEPGTYQGFWRLQSGDGDYFGIGPKGDQSFWIKISVTTPLDASPTSDLTPTMSLSQTPTPSETPSPMETPSPTETPIPSASPQATPKVHHQGDVQLTLGQDVNLDNGEISTGEGEDIALIELTPPKLSLTPQNNAILAIYSGTQRPPSFHDCELTPKSSEAIPLSELAVNDILCYITNEGRFGYMTISALNSSINFSFTTWVP